MNAHQTLNAIMFTAIFQLATLTSPANAQIGSNNEMVNISVAANGQLKVIPSKTSSKNDFDFFMGDWTLTNRKLKTRLNNSNEWLEFDAEQSVKKTLYGLGNTDSYNARINGADFEGMTLRLFDPKTRLWSIYWADSNNGKLDVPVVGSFENNIGRFYTKDTFNGKPVIMQFKWDKTNPEKPEWSQAYSADNGKTWEWNWYMNFKRRKTVEKDEELSRNETIKVLELRNYILKPGKRDDFIDYFEQHFITTQNLLGGYVLGQFRVKDQDDRFLWFRGFNDMASRSAYLPEFYRKSLVWQKYKAGANALINDNDDVHLLKPLVDSNVSGSINTNTFARHKGISVIDYYTAVDGGLDKLIGFYRNKIAPLRASAGITSTSLWVSELTPNDYPSLPVIQDKDLLVVITFYKDEADYRARQKLVENNAGPILAELKIFVKVANTALGYPTKKSFGEIGE